MGAIELAGKISSSLQVVKGVEGIVLGGSNATGTASPASDKGEHRMPQIHVGRGYEPVEESH